MEFSLRVGSGEKKQSPPASDMFVLPPEIDPPKKEKSAEAPFTKKSMVTTILCIFYVEHGETLIEIDRKKVSSTKKDFLFHKEKYIVNTLKIFYIKPWMYSVTKNYQPCLEYLLHKEEPLARFESQLPGDADSLNRLTNEANIPTRSTATR